MKNLITNGRNNINEEFLHELLSGKAIAYTIQNYLPKSTCGLISKNFLAHPNRRHDPVYPPINKIGCSLYETANHEQYFSRAAEIQKDIEKTFSRTENPMKVFLDTLSKQNIGLISPVQYKQQNAVFGIIRQWHGKNEDGLAACIHEDFVLPRYAYKNTIREIGTLEDQFSIVICLQEGTGGTTRIYNKRPTVEDYSKEMFRQSYGFKKEFVQDVPYIDITLKTGDLLMFRSSLLHSVSAVTTGMRITQQCFLGMVGTSNFKKFRYWS